ncbi:MAG: hypothetical protein F4110_08470 [Acidimicrobiaceae bacterium]|nr:hypothetical protein [Acidimicrobiaceae bacterium]MXZ98679.1 hypothetical protein [Acidimicrobiaceae bacterium]MYE75044.1 hypothetical protein [Acidimicrobiaceae bacterium]MYE95784.1 hypothetical protein [Acidimicrobiaceae bacterium]MYH43212.1 hypothetical protein [Acidimicrobiaceae bacterium]
MPAPDLLQRDFTAEVPNQKWCGDFKQADTDAGPVYLASVEDLFSRRMLGFATSDRYPPPRSSSPPRRTWPSPPEAATSRA